MKPVAAQTTGLINKLLKTLGMQIVRIPNPDRLVSVDGKREELRPEDASAITARQTIDSFSTLDARISSLEARSDDQAIKNIIRYAIKAHWRTVDLIERVSGTSKPTVCALCGHNEGISAFVPIASECRFLGGQLIRHKCPNCDVIFGPQKMLQLDDEMVDFEYRNLYRIYSEGNSTQSLIRTFHLLAPTETGTYLDFGCGGEWSEAIAQLRQEGWNIYGFEPSASNSSEHVFSSWAEVEARQFDGILSHNVLEHLFDPIATTKRLSHLLSPDGRIVHATPCFEYLYEYSHYHVFFFTGRSPEVLAELAGMRITDWVRDGEYIACVMKKLLET